MSQLNISNHAISRIGQRGIPSVLIEIILSEYDRSIPVGDGCECLSISRQEISFLKGSYSNQLLDAATKHGVLINNEGRIVTVMKLKAGKHGRSYRKSR